MFGNRNDSGDKRWYFSHRTIVMSFLIVGPFMLPLVWFNPDLSLNWKIFYTLFFSALSLAMFVTSKSLFDIMMNTLLKAGGQN